MCITSLHIVKVQSYANFAEVTNNKCEKMISVFKKNLSSCLMQISYKRVKTCYKIKIGFRVFVCRFYRVLLRFWPHNIQEEPLFCYDIATIGVEERLFCLTAEAG